MHHVSPCHVRLPEAIPRRHTSPIATSHSSSDDTWITHVGSERALAGSAKPNGHTPSGLKEKNEHGASASFMREVRCNGVSMCAVRCAGVELVRLGVWRVACGVWRVACGVWRVEACGVWWRAAVCGGAQVADTAEVSCVL